MSTGVEIVASVVGIAGAGFRLSLILNAISCEIANAPFEIKAISKSVTLYSLLLKQTAAVLEQTDSVHSQQALSTTEQILEESNAIFNDINAMLDRVRTTKQDGAVSSTIPQRIKWCFKKHGIEYLLGRMDRLQMSLSLMLQIIQLGTTLASTSRHDPPARVEKMTNKISRERVEAQTVVIQYFQENQALDRLYMAAKEEETEPTSPIEYRKDDADSDALTLVSSQDSQLTKVEEVQHQHVNSVVVSHHKDMLTGLGEDWNRLGESKEDMVKRSEAIINQLLERWTSWREKRERQDQELRQARPKINGRYNPLVQDSHDEEDSPFHERFPERDESPAGKYLEGPTTNWRQPHSTEARQKAKQLRKAYEPYQAGIERGSDIEDSPNSSGSRKRASRKHAIDSDSESSESEDEKLGGKTRPRRRSSAVTVPSEQRSKHADDPPVSKSYHAPSSGPQPRPPANTGVARPPISPTWNQYTQQPRPMASPDQSRAHHSFSQPVLNAHSHGGPQYTYPPPGGIQAPPQYAPQHQAYPFPQIQGQPPRHVPRLSPQNSRHGQDQQRPLARDVPPRPVSRNGKARSPSRLSREYTTADYRAYEEEKKRQKKEARRNISDGAAKGLLAGGGLAVFLEALDSLSL